MSKVKDIKTLKQGKGGEAALGSNSSLNLLHQQSMDRANSALSISDADVDSMDSATVKSRLIFCLKELSNRDTTVRALQRNYETLCTSFEAMKDQHTQRKDAYDELLVKLAQCDKVLAEEKTANAALRARGQQLEAAAADAAERDRLSRADCAGAKAAADKAELEKRLAVGSLEKEREEGRKLKQQLDETRVKLKAAQSDFEAAMKGNGNVHERLQALQIEVADKTKQLQMRDNQLAVAREGATELAVERDALRRQLVESKQHLEKEQQQVRCMLDAAVNKFRDEEVRYQRLCAEQKKSIDELQQGVACEQQTAQQLAADLQAKMDALRKHEEQIGAQQQQLLTASASVAELERLRSAGADRVQQLIDEVALLSQRLDIAGKEAQRLASDNSSQAAQISCMQANISKLQSELERSCSETKSLSSKLQQLEAAASSAQASAAAEAQQLGGRVRDLQQQLENTSEQARATEQRLQQQLQACMSSGGEASKTAASLQLALEKAQNESKKLQLQLQESGKSLSDCNKEASALRLQLQQLQAQLSHMQSQHSKELADRAAAAESAAAASSAESLASAAKLQALQEELTRVGSRLDDAESSRYRTESKLRALEEEKSRAEARARLEAEAVQVAAAKAKLQAQDAEAALQRSLAQLNSAGAEANFIRNEKERLARDMASLLERCQSSEAARTESQRLLKAAEKEKDRVSDLFASAEAELLQSKKEITALKQRLDSENNDSKAAMLEKQRSQMRQTIARLKSATESMEGALTCLHCMQLLSGAVVGLDDGCIHCQACHEAEALGPFVHCDAIDQLAAKFGHQRQLLQDIMM